MNDPSKVEADQRLLREARERGPGATLGAFVKLSGPGWLQSAITLGGGSLASSLYLGVLAGTTLLWLQPLAMVLGIIMLCAIAYVTVSTGERPFRAINAHVNPVLGCRGCWRRCWRIWFGRCRSIRSATACWSRT